jgi:hypothetical protein
MQRLAKTALCGAVAGLTFITTADRSFALEPGDFGQTLTGATIGAAIAVPPPPGLYAVVDGFAAPAAKGTGQNLGTTVAVPLVGPTLFWSTGVHVLGANWSMAVVQPFYWTAAYPSNGTTLAGNMSGSPLGNAIWFETTANTLVTPVLLQWKLGEGWFAAAGITLIAPDGSRYNGTLNPDYFSFEPRWSLTYKSEDWHLTVNSKYDINTPSSGHTGSYQIAANLPFPLGFGGTPLAPAIAGIGNGYRSGQLMFLDVAATKVFGKWEIGPVASFKWQTTADRPGGGVTCAQLAAALPPTLGCGRATNYSIGGLVGYDLGLADFQVWVTDSVYNRDDFKGVGVYSRISFRLWGPEAAPAKPMPTKAPVAN